MCAESSRGGGSIFCPPLKENTNSRRPFTCRWFSGAHRPLFLPGRRANPPRGRSVRTPARALRQPGRAVRQPVRHGRRDAGPKRSRARALESPHGSSAYSAGWPLRSADMARMLSRQSVAAARIARRPGFFVRVCCRDGRLPARLSLRRKRSRHRRRRGGAHAGPEIPGRARNVRLRGPRLAIELREPPSPARLVSPLSYRSRGTIVVPPTVAPRPPAVQRRAICSRNIWRVPSFAIPGTTIASLVRFHVGAGSNRTAPRFQFAKNTGGDFTTRRVRISRKV